MKCRWLEHSKSKASNYCFICGSMRHFIKMHVLFVCACVCVCLCVHLHFISFEWSTSQLPSYIYCSVQFSSVNLRISLDKSGVVFFNFFHLFAPFFASFCISMHLIFSIISILFFISNTYFIVFRWIVLFRAPDASVLKSFVQQNMILVCLHSNIFRSFFIWFVLSLVSMPLFKPKVLVRISSFCFSVFIHSFAITYSPWKFAVKTS